MKIAKAVLFTAVMAMGISSFAQGDYAEPAVGSRPVINCTFTEPFFDITIKGNQVYRGDSSQIFAKGDIVTYKDPVTSEDGVYVKNTTVLDVSVSYRYITVKFDLGAPLGARILHIDRATQGSDGMSDEVYPMEGTSFSLESMQRTEVSGCKFH
ncbi:hypothetical protein [Bdellovibrio sp. HCB288]|uniref:hypothetical protein n=1 Tax=Bdellovibrio sp. HCB288 TaxID=3394355 RepID=UPI0039B49A79